ncbi:hypothetical protein PCO31111_01442 [Pandoraea communis]|uniref:Uncharacterized protein n=1 Tax=Pandoraea communis TaxID=2508297 RepID=A0A5E4TL99_9BURK|nr:hypothetical protein PCO31111_01442 [Pandoraea communis]
MCLCFRSADQPCCVQAVALRTGFRRARPRHNARARVVHRSCRDVEITVRDDASRAVVQYGNLIGEQTCAITGSVPRDLDIANAVHQRAIVVRHGVRRVQRKPPRTAHDGHLTAVLDIVGVDLYVVAQHGVRVDETAGLNPNRVAANATGVGEHPVGAQARCRGVEASARRIDDLCGVNIQRSRGVECAGIRQTAGGSQLEHTVGPQTVDGRVHVVANRRQRQIATRRHLACAIHDAAHADIPIRTDHAARIVQ